MDIWVKSGIVFHNNATYGLILVEIHLITPTRCWEQVHADVVTVRPGMEGLERVFSRREFQQIKTLQQL